MADAVSTAERAAVRRRPVQAPTTTTGLTVVDGATGTISAIPLASPAAEPAPQHPEPRDDRAEAPPERTSEPASTPTVEPGPEPAPETEGALRRRSVMGRGEEIVVAPAVSDRPEPPADLPSEDEPVERVASRSALATILRFLVLLVAAFVIGALIWTVAEEAAAQGVVAATELRGER